MSLRRSQVWSARLISLGRSREGHSANGGEREWHPDIQPLVETTSATWADGLVPAGDLGRVRVAPPEREGLLPWNGSAVGASFPVLHGAADLPTAAHVNQVCAPALIACDASGAVLVRRAVRGDGPRLS